MATSFPKITVREFFLQIGSILKTLLTNWVWTLGLVIMVSGGLLFTTALGNAGITKILPIVCLTGVVAAFVGVAFLKERVATIEWIGIALILLGVVLVSQAESGVESHMPTNAALLSFTAVTVLLTAFSLLLRRLGVTAEVSLSVSAGLVFGMANLMLKLATQRAVADTGLEFTPTDAAVWAAVFTDYPMYLVLAANIVASVFFQTAFANGRASVVSPVVTIISNVVPIIAALIVFGESVQVLHALGIFVVLGGTALLAMKKEVPAAATATES
jgi:drug/metabolite transporter (DMT)-like permease